MNPQTNGSPEREQLGASLNNTGTIVSDQQPSPRPLPRDRLRDVPHHPDDERAVLAVVVFQHVLPSSLDLEPADFYNPDHEALWSVLETMEAEGLAVDAITASDRLTATTERLSDPNLVTELAGGDALDVNAQTYAATIRADARARAALAVLERALQRVAGGEDPADVLDPDELDGLRTGARRTGSRLGKLVDPAQVKAVRREWIKRDWYPCDVVTILAGHGGEGKSTFSLADVAAGSRGELHGRRWGRPVRSLIVATEDTASDQKLRLKAAGANLEHVRFFTVTDPRGEELHFNLELDLAELRSAAQHFGADLLVIDPLSSVTSGLDLNKAADMRKALDPLTMLARQLHVAVLVVHHFNKGGGNASRKMTGSEAIRDIARSVIHFAHDKETDERVLTFDKGNYSTYEGRSFNFELESAPAIDDAGNQMIDEEGNLETVPVARLIGETDNSVERIINSLPQGQEEGDRNEARAFLLGYLSDNGGEVPAGDVLKAGHAAGFDDKQLKNARIRSKDPSIESRRATSGKGWVWAVEVSPEALRSHTQSAETLETSNETSNETRSQSVSSGTRGETSNRAARGGETSKPVLSLVPNGTCSHCGRKYRPGPKCNYCGTPTGEVAS